VNKRRGNDGSDESERSRRDNRIQVSVQLVEVIHGEPAIFGQSDNLKDASEFELGREWPWA
jgi:hypothetical protein